MDKELATKLNAMILKANRSLEASKNLFKNGDYDFAVSRAYYAAFYMLEALLLTKGLEFSKHDSVIGAFNKNFIFTGEIKNITRKVYNLFGQRQISDYSFEAIIKEESAKEDIGIAEEIVNDCKLYLIANGFV